MCMSRMMIKNHAKLNFEVVKNNFSFSAFTRLYLFSFRSSPAAWLPLSDGEFRFHPQTFRSRPDPDPGSSFFLQLLFYLLKLSFSESVKQPCAFLLHALGRFSSLYRLMWLFLWPCFLISSNFRAELQEGMRFVNFAHIAC